MNAGDPRGHGPLRVAVYDLYWSTLGGGEQVDGTIASVAADAGHDVTLLGPERPDVARMHERLGVDLSHCEYRKVSDDREAESASGDYDLFVNGTYLSRAPSHAALSYYYVHFPGIPPGRLHGVRNKVFIGGVKALGSLPLDDLPTRIAEVRAGFDRRIARTDFIDTYDRYLANSEFTARWVDRLWKREADVLYPPVRPTVVPGAKRPLIVSLGRFFDPEHGHSKKQLDLVEAFIELEDDSRARGWELAVVGGCDATNRDYALAVKRLARDHRVQVHVNATGERVTDLLGEASIYWHAAGLGEDPERHPEKFEHFGIAVVEAMAAGAAPVVYGVAGPGEIVRPGVDGFHWSDRAELLEHTRRLIDDEDQRTLIGNAAIRRSSEFSAEHFSHRFLGLVADDSRSIDA